MLCVYTSLREQRWRTQRACSIYIICSHLHLGMMYTSQYASIIAYLATWSVRVESTIKEVKEVHEGAVLHSNSIVQVHRYSCCAREQKNRRASEAVWYHSLSQRGESLRWCLVQHILKILVRMILFARKCPGPSLHTARSRVLFFPCAISFFHMMIGRKIKLAIFIGQLAPGSSKKTFLFKK